MGSTSHRSLATGSLLWGMGFQPQIAVGINDSLCFAAEINGNDDTVTAGTTNLAFDGTLSASDSSNLNAYMPGATALQFEGNGTFTMSILVTGRNQFGETVTETVALAPSAAEEQVMTNHCYTFVASALVTAVSGWSVAGDTLEVGFEHNDLVDCPYPLPFRVRDADHIQAITIQGTIFDGTDITVSKVYNTVTVANSATNIQSVSTIGVATISLVNGSAETY